MNFRDLIVMCLRNLTRRKFRTFLTVSGVVIGTTSIVIMISLGVGISQAQDEMFAGMGDLTLINVYSWGSSTESVLNDDAVDQMQAITDVVVATPFMEYYSTSINNMNLFAGRKNRYVNYYSVIGVKPEALEALGYTMQSGDFFDQGNATKKIQMIAGEQFVYFFQDTKKNYPNNRIDIWSVEEDQELPEPFFDPLTQEYNFVIPPVGEDEKEMNFEAEMIGIIQGGEYRYDEKKQQCFMDIEDMQAMVKAYEKENKIKKDPNVIEQYDNVKVKVSNINLVSEVQEQIEDMGFMCDSMQQYRDQMQESTQQIQLILAILGGVSLFVSAISITNTMIMSVYERTREIGVMKVLGCLVNNIRTIFLMEAGLIGLMGGVFGVGLSYLLSYLLNTFGGSLGDLLGIGGLGGGGTVSVIPPWLVLLGIAFATLIGLISGFFPANRAMRISALEAIKTE